MARKPTTPKKATASSSRRAATPRRRLVIDPTVPPAGDGSGIGKQGPAAPVPPGGQNGNGSWPVRDLSAFPILTEEVAIPSAPSGLGTVSGQEVGARAFSAVQDVLGWRPRTEDPRGFKAALERNFELDEVGGHVVWKYTPRGYAVAADMGAVTGAQASLLNRARAGVDLIKPLLLSLTPLACSSCEEDYDPIRNMVLAELDGLVGELAQPAGPRTQVVDDLFRQLLGAAVVDLDSKSGNDVVEEGLLRSIRLRQLLRANRVEVPASDNVVQTFGHLYTLQQRLGLNRSEVNTVDDERVLSSFMTIEDTVFSLWFAWWQERGAFGRLAVADPLRGLEPFLGTQLVLVSRALGVLAEAEQELEFALNSVFVGPPERQTIRLTFLDGEPDLYLSEVLDWIGDVALRSGPRYINEAGKDGVIAIADTVVRLQRAVDATVDLVRHGRPPAPAMRAPRVYLALEKVASQLAELVALTARFRRTAAEEAPFEAVADR